MADREFSTHEVFNQSPEFGNVNLFTSDRVLVDIVAREAGTGWQSNLTAFGEKAGSARYLEQGRLANENTPKLRTFDQKGNRLDIVEFHPAYHQLMSLSMEQGLHSSPWDHLADSSAPRPGAHLGRCAGVYMVVQMEAGHVCPISMTYASVPAIMKQGSLAKQWLPKILSRTYDQSFMPATGKSAVTIGMGMTEKQGGTDVRANTTGAEPAGRGGPGEEYIITGHKWFMSAPMCDAFLVLAYAPVGLSCFLLPRFLPDGSINVLRFQRLKEKLGNRSNASSEVEFHRAHGWLIGEEGRGITTIIEMVNHTRLDCALGNSGLMRIALANAIHHTRHRTVFQKKLIDQPLMAQVLADMALDVEAATRLTFRLARSFDHPEDEAEQAFRRLMTPVIKYWVCKIAPALAYEAMECLGGNGYVEEGIMSRIYREVPLYSIWEGSGNVMCLDVLRVVQKEPEAMAGMMAVLQNTAGDNRILQGAVNRLKEFLSSPGELEQNGRSFVELLAVTNASVLMQAHSTQAAADAFISSRLDAGMRYTYGAGIRNADIQGILAGIT